MNWWNGVHGMARQRQRVFLLPGEADDWLDKTVNVPTVNSLTLPQGMAEFERLKRSWQDCDGLGAETLLFTLQIRSELVPSSTHVLLGK